MNLDIGAVRVSLGGTPILRDATLTAEPGDFVGLVGPNGSGKTTLLRTVYRALRPDSGVVRVGGEDVWSLSPRAAARRTAAVLQSRNTPGGVTVAEVVALGRTAHHGLFSSGEDRSAVRDALKQAGVADMADRAFGSLSGGERQRVLLACALAQRPRVLVLDEPTNHLDIRARFELMDLVRGTGITVLAVLHDLDIAARYCDRLVVLHQGVVTAAGPVLNVLTPGTLREVFGVNAAAELCGDGVVRVVYHAAPLA
ncbi:ABC transporter ATP-binding protein [Actinokineospora fastidiosa]|uniref:ABC transporter ATP-binding protein n=1 Tax=Actinokineospora fastidiosa TaxID=1816 RepID=A0A918GQ95_9PSEU|nr:ABC transporter ATP-binding protein [Actinokineospora fastidiosa]GGS49675.1 ABC transporter ATP-binding protein [Actinokineospora fastidiosa]